MFLQVFLFSFFLLVPSSSPSSPSSSSTWMPDVFWRLGATSDKFKGGPCWRRCWENEHNYTSSSLAKLSLPSSYRHYLNCRGFGYGCCCCYYYCFSHYFSAKFPFVLSCYCCCFCCYYCILSIMIFIPTFVDILFVKPTFGLSIVLYFFSYFPRSLPALPPKEAVREQFRCSSRHVQLAPTRYSS